MKNLLSKIALNKSQDCFLNKYENILGDKKFQRFGRLLHIVVDKTKSYDNLIVNDIMLSTFYKMLLNQVNLSPFISTLESFASIDFPFGTTGFRIEKKHSSQVYLELFFLTNELLDKKQQALIDLVPNVLDNGLSILKEDFIAYELKKIFDEKYNATMVFEHQCYLQEQELISLFDMIVLLKEKIWKFVLIVQKFIDYTNEPTKSVSLMEEFFKNEITFPDYIGWNNSNFIVFEGWLVMIRYLINSSPSSIDLTFQRLNNFLYT